MNKPPCGLSRQVAKINGISSTPELDGYEAEAKRRGITTDEISALHQKRKSLTPKGRRAR